MRNLLDIASILTKKKIAKIEILDEQILKQKDSLFGKFYKGLITGKIETDEDATQFLYGTPDPSDAKYRQLKSRFRRRLLNTLFFIDVNVPLASNYDQALLNCSKEWAIVEILFVYESRQSAVTLARQVFSTALKFHFASFIIKSARLLQEHALEEAREKEFRYYNSYLQQYLPVQAIEIEAETLCQEATLLYLHTHCDGECIKKIETIGNALIQLTENESASKVVHFYMYAVWTIYYEVLRDYEGMLEVCQNGEQFLKGNSDLFDKRKKSFFFVKRLSAYLHEHRYQEGKIHADEVLLYLSEDSLAWLDFMKYYLLLSLHTDHVINALAIFSRVASATSFKKLDGTRREEWELIEGMLHYLIDLQNGSATLLPKQRRKTFKLSDFISRPIDYQQQQVNLTVQRVTLQILFLLHRHSYQGIAQRTEQLHQLARYELKKEGYERPYAFVRLLSQLNKADFNPKNMRNSEKYLQKLQEKPYFYQGKAAQFEILPYEKLWQLVCKYLE